MKEKIERLAQELRAAEAAKLEAGRAWRSEKNEESAQQFNQALDTYNKIESELARAFMIAHITGYKIQDPVSSRLEPRAAE